MTIPAIINELATRADDILETITDRTLARTRLLEELTLDYPDFTVAHRAEIVDGVLALLDADEFFGWEFCGDPFAEEVEPVDPEDL